MVWVLAALAVVVIGLAAVAGSGRFGEFPGTTGDRPNLILPERVLTAADVDGVRFAVVSHGYAMDQVDHLLDRLVAQMRQPPEIGQPIRVSTEPEPGIMEANSSAGERMHDGSDETSYR